MTEPRPQTHSRWCIVVADAAAPDWMVSEVTDPQSAPVQYCGLGEPTTMLQKALHRARRIAHATRILVTAAEVHRSHWQSALWFMPTEPLSMKALPNTLLADQPRIGSGSP